MTEEKIAALLAKHTPDAEKRQRADFIVDSSQELDDPALRCATNARFRVERMVRRRWRKVPSSKLPFRRAGVDDAARSCGAEPRLVKSTV